MESTEQPIIVRPTFAFILCVSLWVCRMVLQHGAPLLL